MTVSDGVPREPFLLWSPVPPNGRSVTICAFLCGREVVMVDGRVPLMIVYLLVRQVLSLAVLLCRRDLDKGAELLALMRRPRPP